MKRIGRTMADSGSERAHNKVWAANLEERLLATSRLYREDVSVTSEHRTIAPGPIYCTIQRDYPPMWCAAYGRRRSGAPRLTHRIASLRRTSRMPEIRTRAQRPCGTLSMNMDSFRSPFCVASRLVHCATMSTEKFVDIPSRFGVFEDPQVGKLQAILILRLVQVYEDRSVYQVVGRTITQ